MAVNFDRLVVLPAMETFARPVRVYPVASQPGAPSYLARGIFTSTPIDIPLDDGSVVSEQDPKLHIRASEFAVPVVQGDQLVIPDALDDGGFPLPSIPGLWTVFDPDDDGQGGTVLTIKQAPGVAP